LFQIGLEQCRITADQAGDVGSISVAKSGMQPKLRATMLQPLANITIVNITLNQASVSVGNITGLAGQASKAHGRDTLVVVYMCNVFLAGQHLSTALLLCLYCP